MPKAERGTPKDIANRIKAKGLQKLKFYCQMCQKQCRDENGFKCHLTSDSHLRQMKIFSENSTGMMDSFSKEFEQMYLETLRRRHGTKRVNANNVYQEVIQDRHHIHMNSTKWTTLTEFCQHLGKTGRCVVEETERGWYVQYIERDAAILARQEAQRRRAAADKREEEKQQKMMETQRMEAAKALDRAGGTLHTEATKILDQGGEKAVVSLSISASAKKKAAAGTAKTPKRSVLEEDDDEVDQEVDQAQGSIGDKKVKSGAINESRKSRWGQADIPPRDQREARPGDRKRTSGDNEPKQASNKKQKKDDDDDSRKENWLHRDILVRIISKKLANGKYYKRKGAVDRVIDKFTAEVEILDSGPDARDGGDILRLDQEDLETVVPKEGKSVRILNGRGRGKRAKVVDVDKKRYRATLKLEDGRVLERVDYEDFSKIA